MTKKVYILLIRFFLGLVFIFSAISKLFPIEVFELSFVYHGITGWTLAPYISRALIIFELYLGCALLFNQYIKQFILPATFGLLLFFTIYLVYSIYQFGNEANCGCFGTVLPMTPKQSILKNMLMMGLCVLLYKKTEIKKTNSNWLQPILFSTSSLAILLFFPIYNYNFKPNNASKELPDLSSLNGFSDHSNLPLKKDKKLAAVFNMACSHCIEVALKLNAAKSRIAFPSAYFILLGDSSEIKSFCELTHSSTPYKLMNAADYIKQFKSGWPSVYLMKDGKIIYDNNYKSFSGPQFEIVVTHFLEKE